MKRYALILGISVLALATTRRAARAQAPAVGSPEAPDQTLVESAGVKVGEGTVLQPVVGAETGYTSNVFYSDQNIDAPFLRLLVELNFASLSQQRLAEDNPDLTPATSAEGDVKWRAGVRFIGQEYLSTNDNVGAQHNIAGGANVHALVFPHGTWRFGVDDDYIRDNRPTNFESTGNLNRDINNLQLQLKYAPEGRALSGSVRYMNKLDVFERASDAFANRIQHTIGTRVDWQWLPITKVYADLSLGFFEPLGSSSTHVPSMPLRALLGIETALTVNTAVSIKAGYGNGFYERGSSPSQPIFGVTYAWRYSPTGQLAAMYLYDFYDSIQANYFRDHTLQISANQQVDRFTLFALLDLRLRNFQSVDLNVPGVTASERSDALLDFDLSPRYYIKDWFAATLDYDLLVDSTDFRYMTDGITVNPSYVRHQVLAGVRAAW